MPNGNSPLVCQGRERTIAYAVRANGSMPAKEFLDQLDASDLRKVTTLFERMAQVGRIWNTEKFKLVEDKLYEFKSFQVRIGCFQVGRTWFLTHGFIKKKDKWSRSEIDKGLEIKRDHLSRTQS